MSDYIHLDRQVDAFIFMNEFCNCIEQVSEIPGNWKFALITIHKMLFLGKKYLFTKRTNF